MSTMGRAPLLPPLRQPIDERIDAGLNAAGQVAFLEPLDNLPIHYVLADAVGKGASQPIAYRYASFTFVWRNYQDDAVVDGLAADTPSVPEISSKIRNVLTIKALHGDNDHLMARIPFQARQLGGERMFLSWTKDASLIGNPSGRRHG